LTNIASRIDQSINQTIKQSSVSNQEFVEVKLKSALKSIKEVEMSHLPVNNGVKALDTQSQLSSIMTPAFILNAGLAQML